MTSWSYEAFESTSSGRDGVTEMELRVTEKLEKLGPRAEYAKKCKSCSLVELCMPKVSSAKRSAIVSLSGTSSRMGAADRNE